MDVNLVPRQAVRLRTRFSLTVDSQLTKKTVGWGDGCVGLCGSTTFHHAGWSKLFASTPESADSMAIERPDTRPFPIHAISPNVTGS